MKRILLFAAVSVALTGCVNDETESFDTTPSNKKITFEAPFLGKATRAAIPGEVNDNYNVNESFKVWGWYHEGDYTNFTNCNYYMGSAEAPVVVSKVTNENYWASTKDYYWPEHTTKNVKLTFAAYSPADASEDGTFSHTANGLQITDFKVQDDPTKQYDLMYSDRAYNRTSSTNQNSDKTYEGVDIVFHHALSSICFKAKTKADYSGTMEINITKIEVKGVSNQGSFNENLTDGGTERNLNNAWTVTENSKTQDYTAFEGTFKVTNGDEPNPITNATNLILLPQTFGTDNEGAKIVISYTMKSSDSDEAIQCSQEMKLKDYTDAKWQVNKRYTYNLIFALDKIYFAPVVEAWENITVTPAIDL